MSQEFEATADAFFAHLQKSVQGCEPATVAQTRTVSAIEISPKVVSHGRYITFQLAETAVSQRMLADILALDRSTAGAARAGMKDQRGQMLRSIIERYASVGANAGVWRLGARPLPASITSCRC
jgi:hypothetical protein